MRQPPVAERGASSSACSRPGASQNKTSSSSSSKRRKSRAVAKAPVREFSAHDNAHFKRIVQHLTGFPLSPPPPPPPPPAPPPVTTSLPVHPNFSSLPDCSQHLATSAIAHSLLSTLHLVSACLQLLHGGSSPHSNNAGIPSDECKTKCLAFLQGLQFGPGGGSGGGQNNPLHGVNDFLASLSNAIGGHDPYLNPNLPCGSVGLKSSFGGDDGGGDPKPLFAVQILDAPNTTNGDPNNSCCCSEGCGGNDPKPLFAMETHDLANDHFSIPCCDDGLGDCPLSLCRLSPLHAAFHDINYSIHIHEGTLGEELDLTSGQA